MSRFVSVAKDITELRKAALRDSQLQLARDVQQRLLPSAPSPACGLDIAGGALMADETGGDFYDFIPLEGGRMALAIGDVSGHAFDAALVMARIHAQLRPIARAHGDPSRVLALLNQATLEDVLDNQYATALVMTVDRAAGAFVYASAGHTTGYTLDPHGTILASLESTGMPLGLFPHAPHESRVVEGFLPGSLVLLLTDGVMEAESADGLEFGYERALEVVQIREGPARRAGGEAIAGRHSRVRGRRRPARRHHRRGVPGALRPASGRATLVRRPALPGCIAGSGE